jgi:hypothetical protein
MFPSLWKQLKMQTTTRPKIALWEPFGGAGWATCKGLSTTSPLTRYPGSKRRYAELHFPVDLAYFSDSDPSVLAVWEAWLDPAKHADVLTVIDGWKALFQVMGADIPWHQLKAAVGGEAQGIELAGASLALRKLTFGGVVREGAKGKLNIKWVPCQVSQFLQWTYLFPPQPNGSINLSRDWRDSLAELQKGDFDEAIAVIDPPYWLPYGPGSSRRGTGRMSPCYPGHDPHAQWQMDMCVDAFAAALAEPRITQIFVTNYHSSELANALFDLCPELHEQIGRKLDGINPGRKKGTNHLEALWTLDRQNKGAIAA